MNQEAVVTADKMATVQEVVIRNSLCDEQGVVFDFVHKTTRNIPISMEVEEDSWSQMEFISLFQRMTYSDICPMTLVMSIMGHIRQCEDCRIEEVLWEPDTINGGKVKKISVWVCFDTKDFWQTLLGYLRVELC